MNTERTTPVDEAAAQIQMLEKKVVQLQMEMGRLIHVTEAVRAEAELKMLSDDLLNRADTNGNPARDAVLEGEKLSKVNLYDDQEVAAILNFTAQQVSSKIGGLVLAATARDGLLKRRKPTHDMVLRWLEQAGLFDRKYYLSNNKDVADSGIDPGRHYIEHGAREGRQPSYLLDVQKSFSHDAGN